MKQYKEKEMNKKEKGEGWTRKPTHTPKVGIDSKYFIQLLSRSSNAGNIPLQPTLLTSL